MIRGLVRILKRLGDGAFHSEVQIQRMGWQGYESRARVVAREDDWSMERGDASVGQNVWLGQVVVVYHSTWPAVALEASYRSAGAGCLEVWYRERCGIDRGKKS